LSRSLPGELTGLPLMKALRGLAYTGLALEDGDARLEQAFGLILAQINEQILPDGAHISRSPRNTFEFLQCLVDLRTSLIAAKIELPEEIQHAIDRITPAVVSSSWRRARTVGRLESRPSPSNWQVLRLSAVNVECASVERSTRRHLPATSDVPQLTNTRSRP